MYNIGGVGSSHSIAWCDLRSPELPNWKILDLPNHIFSGYGLREAFVVENKIVYFGSCDAERTFVLEKEEKQERLKVVRED